jgi:hypothetical protein
MSKEISLKDAERRAFTSTFQDGLWDILVGCIILLFAIAPFLSRSLGDFWSSAVFLPFWALVFLVIWLVKRYVVRPRVGVVEFGAWRKTRLLKFNFAMLAASVVALILGILSAVNVSAVPGWMHTARFSLIFLIGFSVTAHFMDFSRLYLYGVLIALAPVAGEWLYVHTDAPHHGYPITFGIAAGVAILVGLVKFIAFLRDHPIPAADQYSEGH